jgi:hypothetical protein
VTRKEASEAWAGLILAFVISVWVGSALGVTAGLISFFVAWFASAWYFAGPDK